MNIFLLSAGLLTLVTFIIHIYIGDKELCQLNPSKLNYENCSENTETLTYIWIQTRCAFHMISSSLLLSGLLLICISNNLFIKFNKILLIYLAVQYFLYTIFWIVTLIVSKAPAKFYLKLGQWIMLFIIGLLIFLGINL